MFLMSDRKNLVKNWIRQALPDPVLNLYRDFLGKSQSEARQRLEEQNQHLTDWENNGRQGASPHLIKQNIIREHQLRTGHSVLIETGTYLGDMVEAQKNNFKKNISIELSNELFKKAKHRFRRDKNVFYTMEIAENFCQKF